jgi:hypothetical protein
MVYGEPVSQVGALISNKLVPIEAAVALVELL